MLIDNSTLCYLWYETNIYRTDPIFRGLSSDPYSLRDALFKELSDEFSHAVEHNNALVKIKNKFLDLPFNEDKPFNEIELHQSGLSDLFVICERTSTEITIRNRLSDRYCIICRFKGNVYE